jgi:prepilin-type N-terminal cleavage/methylation domain-containing protein
MMKFSKHNHGFSLVEVMVALLVLAIGILGISKLQLALIRNSSDANQRSVAVSVAQQKIDDLRSFAHLTLGTSTDTIPDAWTTGIATNLLSFAHIADDAGGTIAATAITVGNYVYTLSWDVTDYYYTGDPSVATTPVPGGTAVDFKRVDVTVAWTDEANDAQSITLETVLDSYAPALTALSDNSTTGGTPPHVSYTPESAPDVIDIGVDTGDNQYRQTSKPLPDAVQTGPSANVLVSFEVVTYHEDPLNSGEFFADIQEEFVTLDCKCQFSNSDSTALAPSHVIWLEDDELRVDNVGSDFLKQTATQTGNANVVDEFCSTCCQDHHDTTASAVKYVAGTATGNHVHYQEDGITVADQSTGDTYVESCRFKRINGILRVFQDWKLYDVISVLQTDLADGEALQTAYSTYVANKVLDEVNGTSNAIKPDASTDIATTTGAAHQLQNRGIYIDQVYDDSGEYASYVANAGNVDRLEKIPFSEINLSLLAHWATADVTKVTVSDEAVATIANPAANYYGTYSRGYINALAISASTAITGAISDSNNGFTQLVNASNVNVADAVDVAISVGSAITVSGTYAITYPLGTTGASIDRSPSSECSLPGSPGNTYICNFTSPWTGTVQISSEKTTGNPSQRCSGSSIAYSGSGITSDVIHNFASFACD